MQFGIICNLGEKSIPFLKVSVKRIADRLRPYFSRKKPPQRTKRTRRPKTISHDRQPLR